MNHPLRTLLCLTALGVASLNALRPQPQDTGIFVLLADINKALDQETQGSTKLAKKVEATYHDKFKKIYSSDRELATNRDKLCKDALTNVRNSNGNILEEFMKKEGLSYTENTLGQLGIKLPPHYMTQELFINRLKELQVHQAIAYLEEQLVRAQDKNSLQPPKPNNQHQDVGGGYVIEPVKAAKPAQHIPEIPVGDSHVIEPSSPSMWQRFAAWAWKPRPKPKPVVYQPYDHAAQLLEDEPEKQEYDIDSSNAEPDANPYLQPQNQKPATAQHGVLQDEQQPGLLLASKPAAIPEQKPQEPLPQAGHKNEGWF